MLYNFDTSFREYKKMKKDELCEIEVDGIKLIDILEQILTKEF